MLKALIIEDEIRSVNVLVQLLANNKHVKVQICGIADTIEEGLKMIQENKPNIVFMDIELKDGSSFQILEQLDSIDFKLIFVTAFNEFAIDAFRFSAMDYILKPIDNDIFDKTLEKLSLEETSSSEQYEFLKEIREYNVTEKINKIALIDGDKIFFESLSNIKYLIAKGNYTEVTTTKGKTYTMSKNLGHYADMLSSHKTFFRVHYSTIINIEFIKKISKISNNRSFQIELKGDKFFTVSRRRVAEFRKIVDF